jgi:hypothetical protein
MKIIIFLFLFLALRVNAESCVSLDGQTYLNNGSTLEQCTEYIVMTYQNYHAMELEKFNPDAYDFGFGGVIKMFVVGLGIGSILGMIFKLRR